MKSKQAIINITDSDWVELEESFDILSWAVYSNAAIYVQEYGISGWGNSISISAETPYLVNTSIQKIRIKSQSGNATVNYTLLGFIVYRIEAQNLEAVYLLKDGSNADETINIGEEDFQTTGEISGGTGYFGDNNNYAEFESDGTLKFIGNATVFKDERHCLLKEGLNNPSDKVLRNYEEGTLDFTANGDLTEYAIVNIQMNHDWKVGSIIYPHIHWFQNQDAIANFLIQYRWQINGEIKETTWTNYILDTNFYTYVSGILVQMTEGLLGITPHEDAGISDIIQIRLIRDTNNDSTEFSGSDVYSGTVSIIDFDIHYEINTLGSKTQYSKD